MDVSGRDDSGRFQAGHAKVGGRRRGQSLSAELRRQLDPQAMAARLIQIALSPKTSARDAISAMHLIADRAEGKAIARSLSLTGSIDELPVGWHTLPEAEQLAFLNDLRARAIEGALPEAPDDGEATE